MDLTDEGIELDLLVFTELDCEDLVVYTVLVLVVALPNYVIYCLIQVLLHQVFLDYFAGLNLSAEHLGLAHAVEVLAPLYLELLLLVFHSLLI